MPSHPDRVRRAYERTPLKLSHPLIWDRYGCPVHGEDIRLKIGGGGLILCATCGEKIIELPKKET